MRVSTGTYDLLLRGGHVIDPDSGLSGQADVAVAGGKISAVGNKISGTAVETVDVGGSFVVPGLVDFHVHVYWGATVWGLEADKIGAAGGTTSFLDTGSSGAITLPGFRRYVVDTARTTVRALVHICTAGLVTNLGELRDPRYLDVEGTVRAIEANRDIALGVKIRYSDVIVGEGDQARAALLAALEAAERSGTWLMVHIGRTPEPIADVLQLLRSGDVVTHSYTPLSGGVIDDRSLRVSPAAIEARAAGVQFDIGHGKSSFGWAMAEAALAAGFAPDFISSDLHRGCVNGPAFDLPSVMTKFWMLGMPIEEIVMRCTSSPARKMGLDAGTLRVGAPADIAVLAIDEEPVSFVDCTGECRVWDRRLSATHTYCSGVRLDPEILGVTEDLPVKISSRPMGNGS